MGIQFKKKKKKKKIIIHYFASMTFFPLTIIGRSKLLASKEIQILTIKNDKKNTNFQKTF